MADDDKNEEMLEFRMESKRQSQQSRLPVILAVSLVILSLLVVGVVVALVWKYAALANGLDNLTVTCKEVDVVKMYPGRFLTPEQHTQLQEIYARVSNNPQYTFSPVNCSINCNNNLGPRQGGPLRRRRGAASVDFIEYVQETYHYTHKSRAKRQDDPPLYHGCCESSRASSAPDTATDVNGKEVELVQLDGCKQYFMEETCVTVPSCSICTCAQPTPFINQAVVYKNKDAKKVKDKYEQVYIKFPGCCKCLNIVQT